MNTLLKVKAGSIIVNTFKKIWYAPNLDYKIEQNEFLIFKQAGQREGIVQFIMKTRNFPF